MRKFVNADDASADFDDFIKMLVVIIVILFATAWSVTYIVPHGNVGVYERLGVIDHIEKEPGLYFTLPWARIIDYSVQTQEYEFKEIKGTLTQEGLEFKFDASILYSIQPDKASEIRESISGDYFETIIVPSFSSIAREEIKRWLIEDIYSGKSTDIQEDIFIRLKEEVAPRGINIESVYIRATGLPPLIKQAIENKITEKQAVEQMNFTVQKEIAISEQRMIRANATAQVNNKIAESITPELLAWEKLQVQKEFAKSGTTTYLLDTGNSDGNQMILPVEKN